MKPSTKLFVSDSETIHGVSQELQSGRRSSVEVVQDCLDRIDQSEAQVQAWVRVDRDGAMAQARERDRELAAGRWRGPLHGIPIAIKDLVDVAGFPTLAGLRFRANHVATEDATIVARLREAGAVILGKTVTTQAATFDPPPTRNPWNLERTPGGSSSGSAAAVATGMCLGAVGSQTGGSITRPASYCGVAGCKPTYGRVSVHGILPLAPSMDHPGPLARTVHDLAILLDVLAGPDARDPLGAALPAPAIFHRMRNDQPAAAPRLGRLRGLFEELADPVVHRSFEEALKRLDKAGASIREPSLPPSFAEVLRRHRTIMAVEAAAWHQPWFQKHPDEYLPRITELLNEGLATPAPEYARCRQHQVQLSREMLDCFRDVDVLVTPATTTPAPDRATTGNPAFNSPWSYTGLPVVSFPIGLAPDGLPLSIQLVGRPWGETDLFRAAAGCEAVMRKTPPG